MGRMGSAWERPQRTLQRAQEFNTSHAFTALRHHCPVPSSLVSLALALSTQQRHQKVPINPETEAQIFWSLEFQLLRHNKMQALGENEIKRKIIILPRKVFPPTNGSNPGILTSERWCSLV